MGRIVWAFVLAALVVGCDSGKSGSAHLEPQGPAVMLWPENRTASVIRIATHRPPNTSATTSLGPREDLQPGPEKHAAKGFGWRVFQTIDSKSQGDEFDLHLTAAKNGTAADDRELTLEIPRSVVEAKPDKAHLIVDDKGATYTQGKYLRQVAWTPVLP